MEVISAGLPCITPFKKWLSSFLSLATFTTVEGSVCLVIAGTKFGLLQEISGQSFIIWPRRGTLCMQVFRVPSHVSYTIEQDQVEPTMFVCLFFLFLI